MKTFPILYKRTKTGAIQYWKVFTQQAATNDDVSVQKESGQLGTASPVKHVEWITQGKNIGKANETSKMQQANLQAESDWKKKRDEGYKSLEDLGVTKIEDVTGATIPDTLDRLLPKFNTDAKGNVKPMLAKAVDWSKVKYPCLVQPKLDGVRCLMVVENGENVTFLSRSGKEYTTLMHINNDICSNYLAKQPDAFQSFILDGEIYSDELSFQEIVAAVKKQRPDSLKLKFRAYDIVSDEKQQQRWERTVDLVDSIQSPHLQLVLSLRVDTKEGIKQAHDQWVSEGYEGAMIRHLDGMYGQGQRSSDLLKVKEFDDSEFKCITFERGQREEDLIAVCVHGEKEFRAKMIGTREHKAELWEKGHLLSGKPLTVKHFGWTDDGLPRFPIGKAFRDE